VAAIPMNWTREYFTDGYLPGDKELMAGLIVQDGWSSDSKDLRDLDQVFLSEAVERLTYTGIFVDAKGNPVLDLITSGYDTDPASAEFTKDRFTIPNSLIIAKGGKTVLNQVHVFNDKRTGSTDIPVSRSGYVITKTVLNSGGKWKLIVDSDGARRTVKLTNDVEKGPKKGEYASTAGQGNVKTKEPIAQKP
jgi:hypothetical protein